MLAVDNTKKRHRGSLIHWLGKSFTMKGHEEVRFTDTYPDFHSWSHIQRSFHGG